MIFRYLYFYLHIIFINFVAPKTKIARKMRTVTTLLLTLAAMLMMPLHVQADQESIEREWRDSLRAAMEPYIVHQRMVCAEQDTMRLWWHIYGEEPADGRSLWISLHGGGGAPAAVNDGQWDNQKKLYAPSEGVYVAPRAPWNTWNMWCMDPIDELYQQLISGMVAYYNVNPDKVYIMGYSAGGDGVWRMAPRMADYWAAASMMAGHPGGVSLVNLRNTPFMIWMGANDTAYDRNVLAPQRGAELDALQKDDPKGYIHETHIVPNVGHWMNRQDTLALDWMAQYKRNPYPKRIVWRQEERVRPYLYWIEAPANELKPERWVEAEVDGNTIRISRCEYSYIDLYLNSALVDLEQPISVYLGDKRVFRGKVKQSEATLRSTLHHRQDPRYACPSMLRIKNKNVKPE